MFNSLKELLELGVSLLNQILVGPFSVVRKTLHMISFGTPLKVHQGLETFQVIQRVLVSVVVFHLQHTKLRW